MNKEEQEKFNGWFRRAAFIILVTLLVSLPILFVINKVSADKYLELYATYGPTSEEASNYDIFNLPMGIYYVNCFLCVVSILLQVIYFGFRKYYKFEDNRSFKEKIRNSWPCFLLAFFMAWTSVGCIQAGMEMNAEILIKQAEASGTEDKLPQRIIDIANWSSTDRMANTSNIYQNAKDRAWHGCENLKDGYFSFMFYATVLLNVLMLGNDSEKHKLWMMRVLLITSIFMGVASLIAFYRPLMFSASHFYFNRAIFNNLNHFGYYITVVLAMSVCMWIAEKSYYFKGLYLLNSIMYFFLLSINNTFGSYIGIFFFMIFLCIVLLIRIKTNKEFKSFVQYLVCLIVFICCSYLIAGASSENYSLNYNYLSYSLLHLNLGDSTYELSFNSFSENEAEEKGISSATIGGEQVKWGTQFVRLENRIDSNVVQNVNGLKNDISKLLKFVDDKKESTNATKDESGEAVVSGEKIKISTEKFQELFRAIEDKYPQISGESFEEFSYRQDSIQKETSELMEKYEIVQENEETTNKSGLTDEVSGIGSGRGEVWIKSLDLVNQRPWFGWGLENMLNEFYQQYGVQEGRTHNLILQLAGTTGIVGVMAYLIATISLFFKCIFDVSFRKFSKKHLAYVFIGLIISTIAMWLIMNSITSKLLFIWGAIVLVNTVLISFVFFKKVKLRVPQWNEFELVGTCVFVAYMISSLFGNSAFYTSPIFMIFLGILTHEVIHKKSLFAIENVDENIIASNTEQVAEEKIVNKNTTVNSDKKGNKKNKNKKRG